MPLRALLRSDTAGGSGTGRIGGRLDGTRVLVPLVGSDRSGVIDQIKVGLAIAAARGGSVRIEDPLCTNETGHRTWTPEAGTRSVDAPIEWALDRMAARNARSGGVIGSRRAGRRIRHEIREEAADTLILPRSTDQSTLTVRHIDRLAARAPCDVLAIHGDTGFQDFASILLAVAAGPHSGLASDVAGAIGEYVGAYVDILHVVPPGVDPNRRQAGERRVDQVTDRLELGEYASPWLLEAADPVETIVEQSGYYGLTVIGAPTGGRLKRFLYGSTSHSIEERAANMVISTRSHRPGP